MTRARRTQDSKSAASSLVVTCASFGLIGLQLVAPMPMLTQVIVAGALLLVAGIPHGALDFLLAPTVVGRRPVVLALYYALYVATLAAVVSAWWVAPTVALVSFGLLSAFHFGEADLQPARLPASTRLAAYFSRGAVVVMVPVLVHARSLEPAVAQLGGNIEGWAGQGAMLVAAMLVAQHLLLLRWLARHPSSSVTTTDVTRAGILALMLVVVPPTLSIAVYLSLWHAPAHVRVVLEQHPRRRRRLVLGAYGLTLLSLVGFAAAWWGVPELRDAQLSSGLLVFVAGLTVPHALTVSIWHHRRR